MDSIWRFSIIMFRLRHGLASSAMRRVPSPDPYWSNVSLLIHAEGENGGLLFEDVSDNAISVTYGGTTSTSTLDKKYGNSSAKFTGSNCYLTTASNEALRLGIGDFTIELWVKLTSYTKFALWESCAYASSGYRYDGFVWYLNSNGSASIFTNAQSLFTTSAGIIPLNSWTHVSLVRSSGVTKMYVGGINVATSSEVYDDVNGGGMIGTFCDDAYPAPNGYFDEFKITKGVARYLSNFSVPTSQFSDGTTVLYDYWPYTIFLLHGEGADGSNVLDSGIIASSSRTMHGSVQADTGEKKIGSSSIFFNGSTDYISYYEDPRFYFPADFTIEFWVRFNSTSGNQGLVDSSNFISSAYPLLWMYKNASHNLIFGTYGSAVSYPWGAVANQWYNIAVSRKSGVIKVFIDGNQVGADVSNSVAFTQSGFNVGAAVGPFAPFYYLNGWMDEIRITKGKGRYIKNFIPKTDSYPDGSLTNKDYSLMLEMQGDNNGTIFTDSSLFNFPVTKYGNVVTSTAQYNSGTSSAYFDGASSYLSVPNDDWLNFGPNDSFYILGSVYFSSLSGTIGICSKGTSDGWTFYYLNGNLYFGVPQVSTDISCAWTPTLNTWYNLIFYRNPGGTMGIRVDNTSMATGSGNTSNYSSASKLKVGCSHVGQYLNGYINRIYINVGGTYNFI